MSTELPLWYIFRRIENATVSREKQQELLLNRIILLSSKGSASGQTFRKASYEGREEYLERMDTEIQAHGIMRFVAAIDMRFSSWLTETEGDLFSYRFRNDKLPAKISILKHIFGEDMVYPIDALSEVLFEDLDVKFSITESNSIIKKTGTGGTYKVPDQLGLNKYFGIYFLKVPELIKQRKGLLYKGWVIIKISDVITTVKKKFESLLSSRLDNIASQVEKNPNLQELAKELSLILDNENIKNLIKPRYEETILQGIPLDGTIEDNHLLLPPCIQDLLVKVNKTGYIGHWERFQLGIFLKVTGLNLQEQMLFWYNKAVDNIGLSFEEFNKRVGYIIRHIYGLEGGKIDYQMPSCKTIQDKMYCSFKHSSLDTIKSKMEVYVEGIESEALKDSRKVISLKVLEDAAKLDSANACKHFLALISGKLPKNLSPVFHPLQYLKIASSDKLIVSKTNLAGKKEVENKEVENKEEENEKIEEITNLRQEGENS
jgi:DNA primase large subunit